jgi:5-methylcytosine-specific restriction endonuclease McrA
MQGLCALCGREENLTRHHLVPRTRHHNKRNKREFDRTMVKETVGLCPPCHKQIHALFSEKELEREYHSLDRLRADPELLKFIEWIRDKPTGFRPQTHKMRV